MTSEVLPELRFPFVWRSSPHETPFQLRGFLGAACESIRSCHGLRQVSQRDILIT